MTARLNFTKEQILAAYGGDVSIAHAAQVLGCAPDPLARLMRRLGIASKPKGRPRKTHSSVGPLNDREWLYRQVVELGRSQKEIARELGTTSGNVAHHVRRHDLYPVAQNQSEASKLWYRKRYPNGRRGAQAANWRGGRSLTGNGYVRLYMPDYPTANPQGQVYEHRYVMEQQLGRLLTSEEVVDHIDRNRSNNAPDNLRLHGSRSQHVKDHFSARDTLTVAMKVIRRYLDAHCASADAEGMSALCECSVCLDARRLVAA